MDVVARLMGTVLSWLHGIIRWEACPGDWVVSTAAAGAVVGLVPAVGAAFVALIRKFIGNRYSLLSVLVFLVLGFGTVWLLPSIGFQGVARAFAIGVRGSAASGLNPVELQTLNVNFCFGQQGTLLTQGPSAVAVLRNDSAVAVLRNDSAGALPPIAYVGLLAVAPLVALLFVVLQSRAAFRRGPRWPRLLLWVPFLLCIIAASQNNANLVAAMWLGFIPASLVGAIMVFLLGAPPWSVINRAPVEWRPPQTPPELIEEELPPLEPPPREAFAESPATAAMTGNGLPPLTPGGAQRFERISKLGEGGFGQVWLALDTQLDRTVALKIAHDLDPSTRERTFREARTLAAVRHPNCVRVYDIVEEEDGLVLVMEYIEGRSLFSTVQSEGTLDDVAAARLWRTMAGALSEAHSKGVLHRDVKPSNVIIDDAGSAQLIDFGIARASGESTLTTTGTMMGTPDFLAPEVINGHPATPASDAWALAATVSYALTGYPPRGEKENPMAALAAATSGPPCTELPTRSAHRNLLAAALSADRAQRPTLLIVQDEVTRWLSRAGLAADGPVTTVAAAQKARTNPR